MFALAFGRPNNRAPKRATLGRDQFGVSTSLDLWGPASNIDLNILSHSTIRMYISSVAVHVAALVSVRSKARHRQHIYTKLNRAVKCCKRQASDE